MKTIFSFSISIVIGLIMMLSSSLSFADPVYRDVYPGSQTPTFWSKAGSPWVIIASWAGNETPNAITVRNGAILTIEAGAEVQFQSGKSLRVGGLSSNGCIIAVGEVTDSITFCWHYEEDPPQSWSMTQPGSWDSVGITSNISDQCEFQYCRFKGAVACLEVSSNSIDIEYCRFTNYRGPNLHNLYGYGIKWLASGDGVTIRRNRFEGTHLSFTAYQYYDIYVESDITVNFAINNNIFTYNPEYGTTYGIYLLNTGQNTITNGIYNNILKNKDHAVTSGNHLTPNIQNNIFLACDTHIEGYDENNRATSNFNDFDETPNTSFCTHGENDYYPNGPCGDIEPNFVDEENGIYYLKSVGTGANNDCRGKGNPIGFNNLPHFANEDGSSYINDLGAYGGPDADSIALAGYICGTLKYNSEPGAENKYYVVNNLHLGNEFEDTQEDLTIEPGVLVSDFSKIDTLHFFDSITQHIGKSLIDF